MIDNENLGGITHPNYSENNSPNFFRNIKPPSIFFIMMRINLKMAWFCLCGLVLFIMLSLWSRCGYTSPDWNKPSRMKSYERRVDHIGDTQLVKEIDCYINNEYTVSCRKEGDEVYLPFTFLHRYFEVYGKLATYDDGVERFEWAHSYGTVYHPRGKYDARGVFMYFEKYNVEARERVKCISSSEGVPVSRQWGNQGYYYPTQIAQFGLSHYSKNLTKPEPQRKIIEDGEKEITSWQVPSGCFLNRTLEAGNYILKFNTMDNRDSVISLQLDHVMDFIMSLNLRLDKNSSITVTLQDREKKEVFNLHYNTSDMFIYATDQDIYHGLGSETKWLRITRDLVVDLQKGLLFMNRVKRKISRSKLKVTGISLQGEGYIDNITFSSSEHISHFYDAANWFVKHQNPTTGGWANPVRRKVAPGFDELEPGWYSAMGQGHAISVLMRAYHHSGGEIQYLQAAIAGLRPFRIPSYQGGVLATFLGKYGWYEEYPTHPPSFVLNGFIYSLLGLYDLMTIAPAAHAKEAALLFKQGMVALKGMLLLYDTGSGTSYDLRHFTLGVAPNLARWDYHTTHVNQLLLLSTLDDADILDVTAKRWLGYLKGKRSAHN